MPVEFKLSRKAEHDLSGQLAQYSGPSVLTKKKRKWRVEHPYVLVVDNEGLFLYKNAKICSEVAEPLIQRGNFTDSMLEETTELLHHILR